MRMRRRAGHVPAPTATSGPSVVRRISRASVRVVVLALPAVLVNVVAASGWLLWGRGEFAQAVPAHVAWAAAAVLAAAVESIAVYLSYEAHQARMAGDAAAFLRLAAYVIAAGSGALNYSHWVTTSESLAIVLAVMSAGSPWLWSVRSQSIHRDQLRREGLIEPRAVRLAKARWLLWFPATWRVLRLSVWYGETDPARAIARFGVDPRQPENRVTRRLQFGSPWPWRWAVVTTTIPAAPPLLAALPETSSPAAGEGTGEAQTADPGDGEPTPSKPPQGRRTNPARTRSTARPGKPTREAAAASYVAEERAARRTPTKAGMVAAMRSRSGSGMRDEAAAALFRELYPEGSRSGLRIVPGDAPGALPEPSREGAEA